MLAVATEGIEIAMLRFSLDGALTEVVDRVEGDIFADLPFWFGADRLRAF